MTVVLGVVVVALSLLAWGGQLLAWFSPSTAVRLAVMEAESDVEPTFWADVRGEALWDALTLWVAAVAGVLMVIDHTAWPHFALVGGGMYLYFAGRGILTRWTMARAGLRIGAPQNVRLGYVFSAVWGAMAIVMIAAAAGSLEG